MVTGVTRRALNVLSSGLSESPVITGVTRRAVTTGASERARGREGVAMERERGRRSYTEGVETERVRERKSFEIFRVESFEF